MIDYGGWLEKRDAVTLRAVLREIERERETERARKRDRGRVGAGGRERERKSLACGRTYSKPTPIASRFLRPLVSTCLYGRPTIFFRPRPSVSPPQDATLIFRRLA